MVLLIVIAIILAVLVFMCAPSKGAPEDEAKFRNRYYAHRGFHSQDKSVPENSMAAFELAVSKGYGIELDIRLSKDGEVVVFHDPTLERLCGREERVDQLTLAQLKELRLHATEETIPTFKEFLDLVDGKVPLIVELKYGGQDTLLCEKVLPILREYNGDFCIESFSPKIVGWFRKNAPDIFRGQLSTAIKDYSDSDGSLPLAFVLSHCMGNFLGRPNFIAYKVHERKPLTVRFAEAMGALKICWVSHDIEDTNGQDGVIFEFYEPPIKY